MAQCSFNRPPRVRPRWHAERVELPETPSLPAPERRDWASLMLPLASAGVFAGAAALNGGSPLAAAIPSASIALLGIAASLISQRGAARRAAAEYAERRALFEDRLEAQRARLRRLHEQERSARRFLAPDPLELFVIAGAAGGTSGPEPRLWERRPDDDDWLDLRVGVGSLPAASQARVPDPQRDGAVDRRLFRTAAEYATLRQVPICIPLGRSGSLGIAGPRADTHALTRALIWQAAVLHGPGDLRLALLYAPGAAQSWAWAGWLPHCTPLDDDPSPAERMLGGEPERAGRLASALLDTLSQRREQTRRDSPDGTARPHLLLIVDGPELLQSYPAITELIDYGGPLGISVVVLAPSWQALPEGCAAMVELDEYGARWGTAGGDWCDDRFTPDRAELDLSDRLARRLASVRLVERGGAQELPRSVRLLDLLGIQNPAELEQPCWWAEPPRGAWRPDVPIGAGAGGTPVYLDLNEHHHGPHGIIAGATGAGKSVLLQSILASLAVTHAPERLQFLLIDFKGGATLRMFAPLPHTAGLVTDLEGRLAARAMTAITSELRRRKALLNTAATTSGTKVEHIADYRAQAAAHEQAPLPNLLIVVDEFDELARSQPEFVAELVRVVKQGRSLGVHLLIATQQPARAVTDEIRSQLSYFIALRLGGADDSREMLRKPDAAFLPASAPGRAYMRSGDRVELIQVAHVTQAYRPGANSRTPRVSFLQGDREQPVPSPTPATRTTTTDLDVLVAALCDAQARRERPHPRWEARPIWQPPLPAYLSLATVDPEGAAHLWDPAAGSGSWLRQPIGLLDIPQQSRQAPFSLGLTDGHLAVVGAPGSGKTTLLRTLVLGLARRHSPRDLWCYLVDASGQELSPLAGLPHVGAHILATEHERVRRLLHLLNTLIRTRQEQLRAADAADLAALRAQTGQPAPAVLVVIDKLAVLREELRDRYSDSELTDELARIAGLGRSCGVYLVVSADRATEIGHRLLTALDQRVALRQAELYDYAELLGVRVSAPLPAGTPGRALVARGDDGALEMQVALPTLTGAEHTSAEEAVVAMLEDSGPVALRRRAAALTAQWQNHSAALCTTPPPIRLLPERVCLTELVGAPAPGNAGALLAPIGREHMGLSAAWLRLGHETPHALVVGPRRSGKTGVLLCAARALVARYDPRELQLAVIDGPRGGLATLGNLPHLTHMVTDEASATALGAALAAERAPGAAMRRVILIDDYTLCRERMRGQFTQSYGAPNLFAMLCEIAQLGGQRGEHVILATASSYADDELLRALDAGRAGLILWPGRYDPGTRILGVSLPLSDQRWAEQPPGRALLVGDEDPQIVQVARTEEP